MGIKVTNWDDIPRVAKVLRGNALQDVGDLAEAVKDGAKARAHVVTGEMRDSIEVHAEGDRTFVVEVGALQGVFEELGTSKHGPHPFLTPAYEEARAAFEATAGKRPL